MIMPLCLGEKYYCLCESLDSEIKLAQRVYLIFFGDRDRLFIPAKYNTEDRAGAMQLTAVLHMCAHQGCGILLYSCVKSVVFWKIYRPVYC